MPHCRPRSRRGLAARSLSPLPRGEGEEWPLQRIPINEQACNSIAPVGLALPVRPAPPGSEWRLASGKAYAPGRDGTKRRRPPDRPAFPLRPDVRWTYRVHEQILPALKRAKVSVRWTDLVVRHTGYADPAAAARKLERNINSSIPKMPSCGFARPWCTGTGENRPRPSETGSGS